MQFQELPWRVAKNTDPTYNTYRSQYTLGTAESPSATPAPLNNLVPRECRSVIKHMLDPDPKTRWSIDDALADKWMMGIKVCKEGEIADHAHTTAGLDIVRGV
jgi:protein-serine/threonine kinase